MDAHRFLETRIKIVDEDRQTCDVIHVDVSNYDVLDARSLFGSEGNCDAAGIKSYAIIDEVAGQTLVQGRFAIAIEGAG